MFFFWHARNKYFKQKNNWSGQIFPILLICLAGLMVAVIVTIRAGEGAKAKTYASNSADACSLAAASCWAGSFNKLVGMNKELGPTPFPGNSVAFMGFTTDPDNVRYYYTPMYNYYNDFNTFEMRARYKRIYEEANMYLLGTPTEDEPLGRPENNALYWSQEAERLAGLALDKIDDTGANCTIWDNQGKPGLINTGTYYNTQAAAAALEAAKCIGAFNVLTEYMKKVTDFFKKYQTENFCNAALFMDQAYDRARKTGQQYTFSNSGTSSVLTSSQGDDFNFHVGTGDIFSGPTATYTWGLPGHQCSISANVELPRIFSYKIKHAIWNYPKQHNLNLVIFSPCTLPYPADTSPSITDDPFNILYSRNLTNTMRAISVFLTENAAKGKDIYDKTVAGVTCCNAGQTCVDNPNWCGVIPAPCQDNEQNCTDNCPNPIGKYFDPARDLQDDLIDRQTCIINGLNTINTALGDNLTILTLAKWNQDIFDKVWPLPDVAPVEPSLDADNICDLVKVYDDGESGYPGMMIINIDSVTLDNEAWKTTCTVTTSCEGGGSTASTSTSKFYGDADGKGELIGEFNDDYYPEIVGN